MLCRGMDGAERGWDVVGEAGRGKGQRRGLWPAGPWVRAVRLLLDGRGLLSNHAVGNAEKPDVLERRTDLEAGFAHCVRPGVRPGPSVTCGCCYR